MKKRGFLLFYMAGVSLVSAATPWVDISFEKGSAIGGRNVLVNMAQGGPLVLGRMGDYEAGGVFEPELKNGALVFSGQQTAHLDYSRGKVTGLQCLIECRFEKTDADQTLLVVPGSWELRLLAAPQPALQLIGYGKDRNVSTAEAQGIESGIDYRVGIQILPDGKMILDVNGSRSEAVLKGNLSPFTVYPHLFVGSSNPEKYRRSFYGRIKILKVVLLELDQPEAQSAETASECRLIAGRVTALDDARFQPIKLDDRWQFNGMASAVLEKEWPNCASFTFAVDFKARSTEPQQTLALVTGVWELRLESAQAGAELVFYLYDGGALRQLRSGPVAEGEWNSVMAEVGRDGLPVLTLNGKVVSGAVLSNGLGHFNTYPQVFIGSANPSKYRRPFAGEMKNIRLETN